MGGFSLRFSSDLDTKARSVPTNAQGPRSGTENDRVHDPSWQQRKQAGDDQSAGENQDHDPAVVGDTVTVCLPHAERNRDQRKDREEMDRTPVAPELDLVDP